MPIPRRTALTMLASALVVRPGEAGAVTPPKPSITVRRDPSCGCCGAWVDHIRAAGYPVTVVETTRIDADKIARSVPKALWSCHTADVDGYVLEGHVPADAVDSLLRLRPEAAGLAVPGMPVGSPGMEVEGEAPVIYDVLLFGDFGSRSFARYRGSRAVR